MDATTLRGIAGPVAHRARREVQWRRPAYRVRAEPPDAFPAVVAEHATPLMRELAGVDRRLQRNKVVNLRLAVGHLDGLVVRPGQRLSVWREVGRPTRRRGYLDGLVLRQGALGAGVGGGLCQLTNLLYWMTLHTPLTVAERWRHSFDVFPDAGRTQPFGSGATCHYPVLDLQVANHTDRPYRLALEVGARCLVGRWTSDAPAPYAYKVYEDAHVITHDAPGVYVRRNVLRRRVLADGAEVGDELVATNHGRLMYAPFLGPGSAVVTAGRAD